MLFDLNRCSSAKNFCNLHAIIAILLIFLHKYLVILHLPLFILLFGKLACTLFPDSKRNNAAKLDCTLPIGDDGSLNGGHSSGKLIVSEINTESEYNSNLQIGMELSIK
jgi:hypothetical protein